MEQRIKYQNYAPDLLKQVHALNKAVDECGLEKGLLHLVKLRASQINGCSLCVNMHSHEALRDGDTQQRVLMVSAWKESPVFSERERAAFAYTDAVTKISEGGVPDALYQATRRYFSEEELTKLTIAIGMINIWNRICVSFHVLHPVERAKAA